MDIYDKKKKTFFIIIIYIYLVLQSAAIGGIKTQDFIVHMLV